jgi:sigma-B regulation protein RsbU (phosphoserine phosphatase)
MPDNRSGASAPSRLRPIEEAVLALHAPGLSFDEVTSLFENLVGDLGLAEEAVFLPESLLRVMRRRQDESRMELAEVRRPDGALIGALRFRPLSERGIHQTVLLARHAGVALSAVFQRDAMERREAAVRRVAERLQDSLLPDLPRVTDTNVVVAYRAAAREAKVGGDFYDVFPLPDARVMIVVGDVVGKGVEAAVRTSRITQTLRALALQGLDLDVLLERADQQVAYQDPDIMATLWCGLYEPRTGELAFASLGHPPALLLRSSGEPIRLELEGLPLGLRDLSPSPPEIRSRHLEPRDMLVLYTDGVVEGSRDFLAGQESLLRAVMRRREEPLEEILSGALGELLADANHSDDAVMLLLRRR